MSDYNPNDPAADVTSGSDPAADGPVGEIPPEGEGAGPGSARSREWVAQLEAMIAQISTQAAPVARQVGAKAAELAAIAAVKAGPVAHRAADFTTDYGQRFAEKAQSVAAELRAHSGTTDEGATPEADAPDAAGDATGEPAPEDTAGTGL